METQSPHEFKEPFIPQHGSSAELKDQFFSESSKQMFEDENIERAEIEMERTCWSRYFGPLTHGSIRGSILTLTVSACGAVVVVLPSYCVDHGIILILGTIFLMGLATIWSHLMLTTKQREYNVYTFQELANLAGGYYLKLLLQLSALFYLGMGCLSNQVIITQLFVAFSLQLGVDKSITGEVENDPNAFKAIQAFALCLFVLLPLSLIRRMSGFNYIAMVSVGALVFLIFVLIYRYQDYQEEYHAPSLHQINYFNFSFNYFSAFAGVVYAYASQAQLVQIYKELSNPSRERINKILYRANALVILSYLLVPLFGYLSTMEDTPSIIVTREAADGGFDPLLCAAIFGVLIIQVVKILVHILPFKLNLYQMIYGNVEMTTRANFVICFATQMIICIISIILPRISEIIGIIGGFACVNFSFFIPLLIHVNLAKEPIWNSPKYWAAILIFGAICIMGWLGAVASVIALF